MLFGEGLNGNGVLGNNPDLHNLDQVGNLVHGTDFRQIYATMLEYWLCIEPDAVDGILGQNFERMPELGMDCLFTSTNSVPLANINHWASYSEGQVDIHYTIPEGMPITVQIFNILGQPVETLFDGYQMAGQHRHTFRTRNARLAGGHYVYMIRSGRQVYSQKIQVVR